MHNVNDLLQCVAVCCSFLDTRYVEVCYSVLRCVAVFCNVLDTGFIARSVKRFVVQCVPVCCRVLFGHQVCS